MVQISILVRDCDKAKGNQNTQGTRSTDQRPSINKIQVMLTDDVSEKTETKVVMKCGVNLKPNHQDIMPEQIVVKQTVKEKESFEENTIEACNSGNTRKRD